GSLSDRSSWVREQESGTRPKFQSAIRNPQSAIPVGADTPVADAPGSGLDPAIQLAAYAGKMAWLDFQQRSGDDNMDPTRVGVILGNIVLPTEATSAMTEEYLGEIFAKKLGVTQIRPAPFRNRFDPRCRDAAHQPA